MIHNKTNSIVVSIKNNYKGILLMLYAIGALTMIIAYRYGSLSVLHPLMATSYILSYIYGMTILYETISPVEILGLSSIIVGVVCIAIGDN